MGIYYVNIGKSWDGRGGSGGISDPMDFSAFSSHINGSHPGSDTYRLRGSRTMIGFDQVNLQAGFGHTDTVFIEAWDLSTYGPYRFKAANNEAFVVKDCTLKDVVADYINGTMRFEQIKMKNCFLAHDSIEIGHYSATQQFDGCTFLKMSNTDNCYGATFNGNGQMIFNDCVFFWPTNVGWKLPPNANPISWAGTYIVNNCAIGSSDSNRFIGNVFGKPSFYNPSFSGTDYQFGISRPLSVPDLLLGNDVTFATLSWVELGASSFDTPPEPGQPPYTGYSTGLFGESRTGIGAASFNPAINAPNIVAQSTSQVKNLGEELLLYVETNGSSPLYQWKKDDEDIPGANDSEFHILSLSVDDAGVYTCEAFNSDGGTTSAPMNITVNSETAPVVQVDPDAATRSVGETVIFSILATGEPTPTYLWRKNGNPLSNGGRFSGVDTNTLTITSLVLEDDADYDCFVENTVGSDTSSPAHLTMQEPPHVTVQPLPLNKMVGQPASFHIEVTGTPAPTYEWRKDGLPSPLSNGGRFSGVDTDTLHISAVEVDDAGDYYCFVSNAAGNESSDPATLAVSTLTETEGDVAVVIGGENVILLTILPNEEKNRVFHIYIDEDGNLAIAKKPIDSDDSDTTLGTDAADH